MMVVVGTGVTHDLNGAIGGGVPAAVCLLLASPLCQVQLL